jgi:hypothetical protein
MDNIAPPIVCVFFGMLQHKFGPKKVCLLFSQVQEFVRNCQIKFFDVTIGGHCEEKM